MDGLSFILAQALLVAHPDLGQPGVPGAAPISVVAPVEALDQLVDAYQVRAKPEQGPLDFVAIARLASSVVLRDGQHAVGCAKAGSNAYPHIETPGQATSDLAGAQAVARLRAVQDLALTANPNAARSNDRAQVRSIRGVQHLGNEGLREEVVETTLAKVGAISVIEHLTLVVGKQRMVCVLVEEG